jgi:hypothetical protein
MPTAAMTAMISVQALGAGLGGYSLLLWFRKARKPAIIAFHVLAGLAGTETLMANIHMSDLPAESPVRALGLAAAICFAVAVLSGLIAALVGKDQRQLANWLLGLHVVSALAGFLLALSFAGLF